jgi:predicted O-linked N-acetylglucosamine transferase (SPINDLY family)/glycosyltransferase involved in cell wall biosynthesis
MPKLSFIIPCMGRLLSLQQILARVVAQPDCTCIVVDYSCPDRCGDWVTDHFPQVRVVRHPGQVRFNQCVSRNLGAKAADTPWLCFCDADILLAPSFANTVIPLLRPGNHYRAHPLVDPCLYGTFVCARSDFLRMGGYDEVMQGWGDADLDVYDSLTAAGVVRQGIPAALLCHMPHDEMSRVRYYDLKDRRVGCFRNRLYRHIKLDLVRLRGEPLSLAVRERLYEDVSRRIKEARPGGQALQFQVGIPARENEPPSWKINRVVTYHYRPWDSAAALLASFPTAGAAGGTLALSLAEAVAAARLQEASGDTHVAQRSYQQILLRDPGQEMVWFLLGNVNRTLGLGEEAIVCFQEATRLKPEFAEALHELGLVQFQLGRVTEAVQSFRRALQHRSDFPEAQNNLAACLEKLGQKREAAAARRRSLELAPQRSDGYRNLARVLAEEGELGEAEAFLRRALDLQPDDVKARHHLARLLFDQGRVEESQACFRQMLTLNPDDAAAHSGLCLALTYQPGREAQGLLAEHRRWADRHEVPLKPTGRLVADADPTRPLRIGYACSDIQDPALVRFLGPVLGSHDRREYQTFIYVDQVPRSEEAVELLWQAHGWRNLSDAPQDAAAGLISDDGIDVLIDLVGHRVAGWPQLFCRRLAPVQVALLGYPGTSGLSAMEYRLTDALTDPPELVENQYSEELIYLPETAWCYGPPRAPKVSPLPARSRGHITFGSINEPAAVNSEVLALWAEVLKALGGAHLVIMSALPEPGPPQARGIFDRFGIDLRRVSWATKTATLQLCQEVDICLDAFPRSGGIRNLDALWMGIPVVCLEGETPASRQGAGILAAVGLADWRTRSVQAYVDLAVRAAGNLDQLEALRGGLRCQLQRSPILDAARFTHRLEEVYRQLWQLWCKRDRRVTA